MSVPVILDALSDHTRRKILVALADGELPVQAIASGLPITQPAVSQHLKVLRDAGLVTMRPDRQRRLYSLHPEPLIDIGLWMLQLAGFWNLGVDAVEAKIRGSLADGAEQAPSLR